MVGSGLVDLSTGNLHAAVHAVEQAAFFFVGDAQGVAQYDSLMKHTTCSTLCIVFVDLLGFLGM